MVDSDESDSSVSGDEPGAWEDIVCDEETEQISLPCQCLFCPFVVESAQACLEHHQTHHNVDLVGVAVRLNLDFYGYIKLVNCTRIHRLSPEEVVNVAANRFIDDEYLCPVLLDDGLLQLDIEELVHTHISAGTAASQEANEMHGSMNKSLLAEERARVAEDSLERALSSLNICQMQIRSLLLGKCSSSVEAEHLHCETDSDAYFSSYAHFGIHEEMLKDVVRTESYRNFILSNADLFKGKVVLDVGCGSGILSLFAAQAGARHVIAVDQSDVVIQAIDIIRENKLDKTITVIKGRAETIELPNNLQSVDIIISEWMGYFLLYESMLDTLLECRDQFLSKGGHIYPSACSMYVAPLSDQKLYQSKISFWEDVYGFKMSSIRSSVLEEPLMEVVDSSLVISEPFQVQSFDLTKVSSQQLDFDSYFEFSIAVDAILHAVVGYFDVTFSEKAAIPVSFSTGPEANPTHWKQAVFFLREPFSVCLGQNLRGRIFCKKNKRDRRALDICLMFFKGDGDEILLRQHYVIS